MSDGIRRGPIRARDLRANIRELGFEQGVVTTLELMLDEHTQDRQHIREMASLLDRCIDEVTKMIGVGEAMKKNMEQIKRDRDRGDEIEHTN